MRLQLIAAAAATAAAAARPAAADGEATATVRVYQDDDRVTVVSPEVTAATALGPRLRLELAAGADAVSGASVDVMTSASPRAVEERRVEAAARVAVAATRTATAGAGAFVSHERDYDAARASVDGRLELGARATALAVRLELGGDRARDVTDPAFAGTRRRVAAAASFEQVVDRRTIVDGVVAVAWSDGWHGSPYRRVPVEVPGQPLALLVREATPARRASVAATVRARRAVGDAWFASAALGGYRDDWAVTSATAEVGVRRELSARVLAGADLRGYLQDAAWFHAPRYAATAGDGAAGAPPLRTADRTLGAMATAAGTLTADVALADPDGGPRLVASIGGLGQWFRDDLRQRARRALIVTVTLTRAW